MGKSFVRGLALPVVTALLTTVWVSAAAAQVRYINSCGTLNAFGNIYKLTADLHACGGDCLVVANNRIGIDLQGHSIIQDISQNGGQISCLPAAPAASGITDGGIARDGIGVANGTISGFVFGIDLEASTRIEVRRVISTGNDLDGIVVGRVTLVKSCQALSNGGDGIRGIKGAIQVQECVASDNDGNGIHVGSGCLITANAANGNLEEGIAIAGGCTVTNNFASDNDDDGIEVGSAGGASLVSANRADGNFDDGIHVRCPGTVTNNLASGNGMNFDLEGTSCFAKNNH